MNNNPAHISPCGLYCGVCGIYQATQEHNQRFLKAMLRLYRSLIPGAKKYTTDDLLCDGCLSERRTFTCSSCAIRDCSQKRQYKGCHECNDFPCEHISNFPIATGKKAILRSIPYRREHGTEQWIQGERKRYICPSCENTLFRGATRCSTCREPVNLN